jgi:hypothetical protein
MRPENIRQWRLVRRASRVQKNHFGKFFSKPILIELSLAIAFNGRAKLQTNKNIEMSICASKRERVLE